jgi:adenylate cyclase
MPVAIIWVLLGWLFLFVEAMATGYTNIKPEEVITVTPSVLIFSSVAVFMVGLVVGYLEMVIFRSLFKNQGLFVKVFYKLVLYTLLLLFVIVAGYLVAAALEANTGIDDPRVWNKFNRFMMSGTLVSTIVQISFSLLVTVLYSAISENLGHAVLFNFFTGKYLQPVQEERIFMFLDMKDSTAIAEELGHVRYFDLLQSYYECMSDAIINSRGEVYQYIGDEVVISWTKDQGIKNNNCLDCFYRIKEALEKKQSFFEERYHFFPHFKAALHSGTVTTGEIGALKKEIVFTGDVLNTTSRIQGYCKTLQRDFLISEELHREIANAENYSFEDHGVHQLKGRLAGIRIFAVRKI